MRAVLKLGGSLLYDDMGQILTDRVRAYAKVVNSFVDDGHSMVVVVGGGKPARLFIAAARELGASEAQCDWLGIKITTATQKNQVQRSWIVSRLMNSTRYSQELALALESTSSSILWQSE